MEPPTTQPELGLTHKPNSRIIPINGRCTVKQEGATHVVYVAGLPMHHWVSGDRMTEAYAMVSLVRCGYADQNDVARAFGRSARTVRRLQRRFEAGGMARLATPGGRPHGSQAAPSPWVQTARLLRRAGVSVRDIAHRLGVGKTAVSKWLARAERPALSTAPVDPREGHPGAGARPTRSGGGGLAPGPSLDPDPQARLLDRLLARFGLLADAAPRFVSGRRLPRAGVLLTVPALVQSGVFAVAEEVYGHLGPAFYGLRTTVLALLLMALLRIQRPEGLKEHAPPDLGRLLGLDRAPEVKTVRRKLTRLAAAGKAEAFGHQLAQRRVAQRGRALGFLYVDGHVRVYHGRRRIGKAYVSRLRLALPATTDYWVNDQRGDPVFVVTAELNAGLVQMLPRLLAEIRTLVGPGRRLTIVFDRGGWSPKLFAQLLQAGVDLLTYRKGPWRELPASQFTPCRQRIEGRTVRYALNDRSIRLLQGRLRLRQITRRGDDGHQTPIVTSRWDLPAGVLAYRMFERWRQENFFKYLREEYALDALVDYRVESEEARREVPNPERRRLDKALAAARAELKSTQARYGAAAAANVEGRRPSMRGFKIAYGQLGQRLRDLQGRIATLQQRRTAAPARVPVSALAGDPLVRLARERKHLTNCIKMVAYQAESDLLALLRPHYARADEEGRTLVTTALQSTADIEVQAGELCVTLAPLSSPHRSRAIAALCDAVNRMEVSFPGTKLRLHFGVAS